MSKNRTIAKDVLLFLDKAATLHARWEKEKFTQSMYADMLELRLESPIEDLFWVALSAICAAHDYELNPSPIEDGDGEFREGYGIHVDQQARIGRYRVDFLIRKTVFPRKDPTPVIVELDGHDFHDKDKHQRAYEKSRDRFLVSKGYSVLHFTGSEVVADPFKVAYESLQVLGVVFSDEYDPEHPLGVDV